VGTKITDREEIFRGRQSGDRKNNKETEFEG
jgi:hypothetical protein